MAVTTLKAIWWSNCYHSLSSSNNRNKCEVARIPESGKLLLVEYEIRKISSLLVESGILGFGIRNSSQGIQSPANDLLTRNPKTSIGPWIGNPQGGIKNPRLSWITLRAERSDCFSLKFTYFPSVLVHGSWYWNLISILSPTRNHDFKLAILSCSNLFSLLIPG